MHDLQEGACGASTGGVTNTVHDKSSSAAAAASLADESFCAELWQSVSGPGGIFSSILAHPFLTGLQDGTLDEAAFRYYIVQDALYLREYGRAMALVGSRAPRPGE